MSPKKRRDPAAEAAEQLYALLRVLSHDISSVAAGAEGLLPLAQALLGPGASASGPVTPAELLAALGSVAGRAGALARQLRAMQLLNPADPIELRTQPLLPLLKAALEEAGMAAAPPGASFALQLEIDEQLELPLHAGALSLSLGLQQSLLLDLYRGRRGQQPALTLRALARQGALEIVCSAAGVQHPAALLAQGPAPQPADQPLPWLDPRLSKEGLRLALARGLVEAHGGSLRLSNDPRAPAAHIHALLPTEPVWYAGG